MKQKIYLVEFIQYKYFSYTFEAPTDDGGYYFTLEAAREAMYQLPKQRGSWVLISEFPIGVLYPRECRRPLELYEYSTVQQDFRRCSYPKTPIERLIFRLLKL